MSKALVPTKEFLPSGSELSRMWKFAQEIADSGLAGYRTTPQQVLAIAVAGRELGLPFMSAVRAIHIIEGKASPSADLIFALIRQRHGGNAMRITVSTAEQCTIRYRDPDWEAGDYQEHTVTMQEAKALHWHESAVRDRNDRSKILGWNPKDNWTYHPAEMLKARAITQVAHLAFPEVVLNLYTPDELGMDTSPNDEVALYEVEQAVTVTGSQPTVTLDSGTIVFAEEALPVEVEQAEVEPMRKETQGRIQNLADKLEIDLDDVTVNGKLQADYGADFARLNEADARHLLARLQQQFDARFVELDGRLVDTETGEIEEPSEAELQTIEWAVGLIMHAETASALMRVMNDTITKSPVHREEAVKDAFKARLTTLKEDGRVTS